MNEDAEILNEIFMAAAPVMNEKPFEEEAAKCNGVCKSGVCMTAICMPGCVAS